jgi:hypothetical protein
MCCGIIGRDLMVRILTKDVSSARRQPHVRPMDSPANRCAASFTSQQRASRPMTRCGSGSGRASHL